MPSTTRRTALSVAAALLTGAAGCSGETSSESSYPSESTGNIAMDPEWRRLRRSDRGPLLWTGDRPTTTDDEGHVHARGHFFVTSADEVSNVGIAGVDGADTARAFLEETDYDSATVYVEHSSIRECFTTNLCHVEWSESDIKTSYAREYRDADVACETDARDTLATLIRIPAAFDPTDINGYGSSRGSASCAVRNDHLRQRRNESERR